MYVFIHDAYCEFTVYVIFCYLTAKGYSGWCRNNELHAYP